MFLGITHQKTRYFYPQVHTLKPFSRTEYYQHHLQEAKPSRLTVSNWLKSPFTTLVLVTFCANALGSIFLLLPVNPISSHTKILYPQDVTYLERFWKSKVEFSVAESTLLP